MNEQSSPHYAGFWIRCLAALIDTALLCIALYGVWYLLDAQMLADSFDPEAPYKLEYFVLEYLVPAIAVILLWTKFSSTPGKMFFGMKIVDQNTLLPVSMGRYIIRYLGYFPSMLILNLGIFWVAFDKRKQGWHDKIAGTVVIR